MFAKSLQIFLWMHRTNYFYPFEIQIEGKKEKWANKLSTFYIALIPLHLVSYLDYFFLNRPKNVVKTYKLRYLTSTYRNLYKNWENN